MTNDEISVTYNAILSSMLSEEEPTKEHVALMIGLVKDFHLKITSMEAILKGLYNLQMSLIPA